MESRNRYSVSPNLDLGVVCSPNLGSGCLRSNSGLRGCLKCISGLGGCLKSKFGSGGCFWTSADFEKFWLSGILEISAWGLLERRIEVLPVPCPSRSSEAQMWFIV